MNSFEELIESYTCQKPQLLESSGSQEVSKIGQVKPKILDRRNGVETI